MCLIFPFFFLPPCAVGLRYDGKFPVVLLDLEGGCHLRMTGKKRKEKEGRRDGRRGAERKEERKRGRGEEMWIGGREGR